MFSRAPKDIYVYWLEETPNQEERDVEVTKPNLARSSLSGPTLALVSSPDVPFASSGKPAFQNAAWDQ